MKPTELMIGDYVRNKRTNEIVWVFEIDDDRDVINNEPDGYNSERNIDLDDIEPISLTPEILEKNGFGRIYDEYSVFYYDKFEIRERELTAEGLCEFELRIGGVLIFIHYIHELQHILRLCELDELADNLKI